MPPSLLFSPTSSMAAQLIQGETHVLKWSGKPYMSGPSPAPTLDLLSCQLPLASLHGLASHTGHAGPVIPLLFLQHLCLEGSLKHAHGSSSPLSVGLNVTFSWAFMILFKCEPGFTLPAPPCPCPCLLSHHLTQYVNRLLYCLSPALEGEPHKAATSTFCR